MKNKAKSEIGGFTANTFIIPLAAVLAAIIACIAVLTMSVNRTSTDLIDIMQQASDNQQLATQLQAGSSILAETCSTFIQTPAVGAPGNKQVNAGPLNAYVTELKDNANRRGPQIAERFREMGVEKEIQDYIDAAAARAESMRRVQEHAIALVASVYPLPMGLDFDLIPTYELTDEELALSAEEKLAKAGELIVEREYVQGRYFISENVESCNETVQRNFKITAAESKKHISALRTANWTMIFLLIVTMTMTFIAFYRWIVNPLRQYAQLITSDQILKRKGAVRELRSLVLAHNDLLRRRNKLEAILRAAAETDALTGLPNRYSLERYVLEVDEEGASSLAVLLFDVNFLKRVNDTQGHLEGDKLLRTAALCIRETFCGGTLDNCYRYGGDEFAAILKDCSEEEIKAKIDRFNRTLEREKISVSVGYAFTEEVGEGTFKKLMAIADKRMYAQKRDVHKQDEQLSE